MKKILFILALAASLLPAAAFLTGIFPGWDNLIAQSPDIVIARCVATQDRSNLLGASFAAPVLSQIEVLSGLSAADHVVLSPPDSLVNGARVRVAKRGPEA